MILGHKNYFNFAFLSKDMFLSWPWFKGTQLFFILANISGHRKLRYLFGLIIVDFEREKIGENPKKLPSPPKNRKYKEKDKR